MNFKPRAKAYRAVFLFLLACQPDRREAGIAVLIESPPDSLDDRLALTANGQRVAELIAPGLVTFDDRSEPIPDLAQSYRQIDDTTIEFTLRPNLTFHDGSALTSADVKATFDAILEQRVASPKADKFEAIARIDAVDPARVRFYLKRPYAPILAELSLGIVPRHRSQMPEALAQDTAPIGAGPFQFSAQADEDHLELLPFDGYYQGKPRISRLRIRTVRDETTRVLELLKGRADLMIGAMSPASLPSLAENPALRVLKRPGTGYAYLAFNLRQPPFSDARVRRAICQAVDASLITRTKFHGLAEPAAGMLPSAHWAYSRTAGCQPDAAAAAKLLEEAGYAAPNRPLQFALKTSNDRFRKSIALIFKEQLSKLGILVELRSLEFGTFFSDVRKGNFDAIILKWSAVIEPDLLRDVFASYNIPSARNHFSGWNRGAYVDPRLDEVLEQAAGTLVIGQRRSFYREAQDILDRDLPYIPLWHEDAVAIVSSHLQDFEPSTHNFFRPLATAREVSR